MGLRISELARQGGVGVETVRFYQRRGLLRRPDGTRAGNRHYDQRDVDRIAFIKRAQQAGFTLARIAELLALDESDDRATIRKLAEERVSELDERIEQLTSMRATLVQLVEECAGGAGTGPCPIVASFA